MSEIISFATFYTIIFLFIVYVNYKVYKEKYLITHGFAIGGLLTLWLGYFTDLFYTLYVGLDYLPSTTLQIFLYYIGVIIQLVGFIILIVGEMLFYKRKIREKVKGEN